MCKTELCPSQSFFLSLLRIPFDHILIFIFIAIIIEQNVIKGNEITGKNLIIAVTGTPASGKSTFSEELAKTLAGSEIIELNDIVDRHKLFSRIDEMGSKVVKLKELDKKLNSIINKRQIDRHLIIVGHLVPEINFNKDITVVLRVGLNELIRRLEKRGYLDAKIKENIISESIDYCGIKAKETCKETYEIESDSEKEKIIEYIVSIASGNRIKPPGSSEISKLDELLGLVANGNKYSL